MLAFVNGEQHSVGFCPPTDRRWTIHVTQQKSFISDIAEHFDDDEDVLIELTAVTKLFKEDSKSELATRYNDHNLSRNLIGFSSLHLFPRTKRDVVVVYKRVRFDHIALHRIGDHDHVYDPEYENLDKKRQMKKKF